MWGNITYRGQQFSERMHIYPLNNIVIGAGAVLQARLVIESDYDWVLKLLTRATTNRFFCRLGFSEGAIWVSSTGVNVAVPNDRVLDTLMFGDAQFPFPVVPWVFIPKGGAIILDLQDAGAGSTTNFAFHGSKLIPA